MERKLDEALEGRNVLQNELNARQRDAESYENQIQVLKHENNLLLNRLGNTEESCAANLKQDLLLRLNELQGALSAAIEEIERKTNDNTNLEAQYQN